MVSELAAAGVLVSVDTMRPAVAEFALGAGARLVNDISGGRADPRLPRLVAEAGVPYVVAHWRGFSRDMQERAVYDDVVREVRAELGRQVDAVIAAGVDPSMIIVDPALGFAKLAGHNWSLLARLGEISRLGGPRVPGAGRRVPEELPGTAARRTPRASRARSQSATTPRWPCPPWPRRPGRGASGCTPSRRTRTPCGSRRWDGALPGGPEAG